MYDTEKEQAENDRDAHKLRNKIPFSPKVSTHVCHACSMNLCSASMVLNTIYLSAYF